MARDLDLGSGHTAYCRASLIDLYLQWQMSLKSKKHIVDGRTFETGFIRSTLSKIRPKNDISHKTGST